MAVLDKIGDQLGALIQNLIIGNTRKAKLRCALVQNDPTDDIGIKYQMLIEHMAQEQAIKSGFINLPSVFPGIGTLISFWLVGAENFLILDQCVTLIMTLLHLHDKAGDEKAVEEAVMQIIGVAFKLLDDEVKDSCQAYHAVTKRYMTRELPQKYANVGVNRILSRLFPYRKGFRLLPIVGVMISAYDGYEVINRVGQTTLNYLRKG